MRITLTFDDDVAAMLERLREERNVPLERLVNEVLRAELRHMSGSAPSPSPLRTRSVDLGGCLVGDVDDVPGVLAVAEGARYR